MPSPYPHPVDLEQWLGAEKAAQTDPNTVWAVRGAASAIEQACGRSFGTVVTETRTYQADTYRGSTTVTIGDTFNVTAVEVDGNPVNAYTLIPRNPNGKPYTEIEIPACIHGWVSVTAEYGWPEVPEGVRVACAILAGRFLDRRENTAGSLTHFRVDDVEKRFAAMPIDGDVELLIRAWRRMWYCA